MLKYLFLLIGGYLILEASIDETETQKVPKHSFGYFMGATLLPNDRIISDNDHKKNLCYALMCGCCLDSIHMCCCEPIYCVPIRLCSPCMQFELIMNTTLNTFCCIPIQCCATSKVSQEQRIALDNGIKLRPRTDISAPPVSTDYIFSAIASGGQKIKKTNPASVEVMRIERN